MTKRDTFWQKLFHPIADFFTYPDEMTKRDTFEQKFDVILKKLFDPSGRSGRRDFLITCLVSILLSFVLIGLYTMIVAYIRRWHDLGRSGWWTLLSLVPFVGWAAFLHLLTTPGISREASQPRPGMTKG